MMKAHTNRGRQRAISTQRVSGRHARSEGIKQAQSSCFVLKRLGARAWAQVREPNSPRYEVEVERGKKEKENTEGHVIRA